MLAIVELGLHGPARTTRSVAGGATTLNDESRNDAVECEPVVEPLLGELDEVGGVLRRDIVPKFNRDSSVVSLDRGGRIGHSGAGFYQTERDAAELVKLRRLREEPLARTEWTHHRGKHEPATTLPFREDA